MKNYKSFLLQLSLLIIIVGCDKENNEKNINSLDTGFTNEEIISCAYENLSLFKSLVSKDKIENYGFNSTSELEQIQIGTPYLIIELQTDFKDDKSYDYLDKYILNTKNWLVPLEVNNKIKCFMNIYIQNDTLSYAGGGSSDFAERVENCEIKYNIQDDNKYLIREKLYGNCDFLMLESGEDYNIYPIGDSINFYCQDAYKVHNSFADFFYTFR